MHMSLMLNIPGNQLIPYIQEKHRIERKKHREMLFRVLEITLLIVVVTYR